MTNIFSVEKAKKNSVDFKPTFIAQIIEDISLAIETQSINGSNTMETNAYPIADRGTVSTNNKLNEEDVIEIEAAFTEAGYRISSNALLSDGVIFRLNW
jgi:hypothetical protein